ncbi:MAG: TonB-dependent receptor [Myxococcales bacterium]|nr:TonB-dependent receptor [Myxococcales bacterium]
MRRAAAFSAALLWAGPAAASVWDTYGFGARATAMGNAHAAAGQDFSAVYYNPAALAGAPDPEVATGLDVVLPELWFERARPDDPDAPSDELPGPNVGAHLGLVVPLGGLIDDRVALGAGIYVPTLEVTRVDGVDPVRPHFYRYEALTSKLVLALGIAVELHETVSVGLGAQFLGALDGHATVELDLLTRRFVRKSLQVAVRPTGALTAGLHWKPTEALRFGFSFRDALALDYTLRIEAIISGAGALAVDIAGTSLYTPRQFTWGAAWDPSDDWTLTADLVWAQWGAAPDPASSLGLTLDGEPLGFGALTVDSDPVRLGAVDTLSPRVGAEWRLDEAWSLRGGYGYRPTPLPAQTGPYNHVDAAAHQLSLGFGWSVQNPLATEQAPLSIEASGQVLVLADRAMVKADPSDAVGDYTAGGHIWHTALTLRHVFY